MENVEKFSIKKLLLCILCGILLTTAIGMTMLFVENVPPYLEQCILNNIDESSEEFKEYLMNLEEHGNVTDFYNNAEENYEEGYPVNGLFQYEITNAIRTLMSQDIVETYVLTFIIGLFLGATVYIVIIQKTKGIKLISQIILVIAIVYLIMLSVNLGFNVIYNKMIMDNPYKMNTTIDYSSYIYDYFDSRLLTSFAVILSGTVIVKLIREKIVFKK